MNFASDAEELSARADIESANQALEQQAGQLVSAACRNDELRSQLARTEAYADELRRGHADLGEEAGYAHARWESISDSLPEQRKSGSADGGTRRDWRRAGGKPERDPEAESAHEKEMSLLRFELGEAEETLAQNEEVSELLTSDLVDSRGYRDQLEKMLSRRRTRARSRIEELEAQIQKLETTAAEREEQLAAKGEAINCLLSELSRKSHEIDSIDEMENVIQEIDDRMSERIDERPQAERTEQRGSSSDESATRNCDFPLFKDRLTIGRTSQNDIQLNAHYISRRHAVVVTEGDTTRVIDWGSKNGVFVNSTKVKEHFLENGDIVTIGTAKFRYEERPKRAQ